MSENLFYTDFLGQEVQVGDFVVYATTSRRSPVIKFARVEKLYQTEKTLHQYDYQAMKSVLVKKSVWKVGVREIQNGRGFRRWDDQKWVPGHGYVDNPDGVRVTYPMPENIVKIQTEANND